MGSRADFYIGRGKGAEWLGSTAWDGYPDSIPDEIKGADTEAAFRNLIAAHLANRDDGTTPDMGWPWPWDDSRTTDYSYAFEGSAVHASCFGYEWWIATDPEPEDESDTKTCVFPDMSERKAVTFGKRSGVIVVSGQ